MNLGLPRERVSDEYDIDSLGPHPDPDSFKHKPDSSVVLSEPSNVDNWVE